MVEGQISSNIEQFYLDPSIANPSAMNMQSKGSLNLFYNRTFTGVTGSPENMVANLILPVAEKRTGFGFFYLREKAGFGQLHNAYFTYAYTVPLSDVSKLHLGASLGVLSQNFDMSKAVYLDQNDPLIRALQYGPATTRADFKISTMFESGNFMAGVGASRISKPRFDYNYSNYSSDYSLQNLANLMAGYKFELSENLSLKPMVLVNAYDFDYFRTQGNLSLNYMDKAWVGLSANSSSQMGMNLGFKSANGLTCGYHYSFPFGETKGILGSVHEFFASISFGNFASAVPEQDLVSSNNSNGEPKPSVNKKKVRRYEARTIGSYQEMATMSMDLDTAGITIKELDKTKNEPGSYVVVGLFSSEAKANDKIKSLYMRELVAYKIFDPSNNSYYVFVRKFGNQNDATRYLTDNEATIPQGWIRTIR